MSPPQGAHALTSSLQGTSSFDLAAARGLVTVGNDLPIDDICYGYLGRGLEGYYITENNSLYRGKLGIEELGNGITYSF